MTPVFVSDGEQRPPTSPLRIVSLNLCTDQLLLLLAPERIAALSKLADDPLLSNAAGEARRYPRVAADAEEVLKFDPDLVIAAPFAALATVNLLRRLGRRVHVADLGQDVEGLKQTLRRLGDLVGAADKAEAVVQAMEAKLAALGAPTADELGRQAPAALVINFGGLPSGPGSLADAALRLAGFRNAVGDYPADHKGAIPLEALVARPPDLLVLGQDARDYRTVQADNLRHPALRKLLAQVAHIQLPQRLTICATPAMAQAVELLRAGRQMAVITVRP